MLVDMSLPLEDGMILFPGLPPFESERSVSSETGAVTHRFSSNTHQGTHVDAPRHYVDDGATVGSFAVDRWVGPARVVDLRDHRGEPIDADLLERAGDDVSSGDRVVLLTGDVDHRFGDADFFDEAAHLTASGAEWLVDRDVDLIANDFLTEALDDPARPVHRTLLGAGIPIVEYLCEADAVAPFDRVDFTCLPLSMPAFEAAPVRAVARTEP